MHALQLSTAHVPSIHLSQNTTLCMTVSVTVLFETYVNLDYVQLNYGINIMSDVTTIFSLLI
jgi:hypothetical protein